MQLGYLRHTNRKHNRLSIVNAKNLGSSKTTRSFVSSAAVEDRMDHVRAEAILARLHLNTS
jgi:hypothetical protein